MFNVKDKTSKEHENNVVYKIECPQEDCSETYIGETERRVSERVFDHSGRDKNSTVYKHSMLTGHKQITLDDVELIAKGFKRNDTREFAEAFLIMEQKPTLNVQNLFKTIKLFTTYSPKFWSQYFQFSQVFTSNFQSFGPKSCKNNKSGKITYNFSHLKKPSLKIVKIGKVGKVGLSLTFPSQFKVTKFWCFDWKTGTFLDCYN